MSAKAFLQTVGVASSAALLAVLAPVSTALAEFASSTGGTKALEAGLLKPAFGKASGSGRSFGAEGAAAMLASAGTFGPDEPVTSGFSQAASAGSSMRLHQAPGIFLEGYVLEWSQPDVETSFSILRRALGHSAGVRQVFAAGRHGPQASVGFRLDSQADDLSPGRQGKDDQELEAGLGWNFPGSVGARAFYGYRTGDTRDDFGGEEKERHRIRLELGHNVADWLRLRASFLSKIHDSSALPSERGRYLACIGFEAKY